MAQWAFTALAVLVFGSVHIFAQQNNDLVLALQQCQGVQEWTLHGLWPNWGSNCGNQAFDPSQVSSILSNMTDLWHSCPEYHQTNDEFWSHEWSKHGTCTKLSQLDFFSLGLKLYAKYNSQCTGDSGTCDVCLTPTYALC